MPFKLIIGLLLVPFALIFGVVAAIRRFLYRKGILRSDESPVPAIDIGNLAVGGTGKTPHTQYVINLLKPEFHVAMLSRGYGRKSKGYHSVLQTDPQSRNAETFGDEPFMTHLRYPDIPLAVDGDRCKGVRNLLAENPETEVIVLDDAYQHLRFRPTFHILLTEYGRPFRPDMPMPAGRLREFPYASRFADMVVVTKVPENAVVDESTWRKRLRLKPHQQLFFTRFRYEALTPVTAAARHLESETVRNVVVLTGIAHPKPMLEHLGKLYRVEGHHAFPDPPVPGRHPGGIRVDQAAAAGLLPHLAEHPPVGAGDQRAAQHAAHSRVLCPGRHPLSALAQPGQGDPGRRPDHRRVCGGHRPGGRAGLYGARALVSLFSAQGENHPEHPVVLF